MFQPPHIPSADGFLNGTLSPPFSDRDMSSCRPGCLKSSFYACCFVSRKHAYLVMHFYLLEAVPNHHTSPRFRLPPPYRSRAWHIWNKPVEHGMWQYLDGIIDGS